MSDHNTLEFLTDWLKQNGHGPDEIDEILERVQKYEQRVGTDAFMESIGSDDFEIGKFVQQLLNESAGK